MADLKAIFEAEHAELVETRAEVERLREMNVRLIASELKANDSLDAHQILLKNELALRQRAEAEIERLRAEKTEIVGIVQRWQPAGSPPPGSAQMLVRWICQVLDDRAEQAEARLADLTAWCNERPQQWVMRSDVLAALAAAQPEVVVVATDSDARKELAAQPEEESR